MVNDGMMIAITFSISSTISNLPSHFLQHFSKRCTHQWLVRLVKNLVIFIDKLREVFEKRKKEMMKRLL